MSKLKTALFTANHDVATSFLNELQKVKDWRLLHLPLENYSYDPHSTDSSLVLEKLKTFSFIIHGNLRNARYFVEWVKEQGCHQAVQNIVHLVTNQATVDYLSHFDIPAVMPREDARPIDIIEFMLRISREGSVLYPTTDTRDEETPGLLQELEIPVFEFQVCKEESLDSQTLDRYRRKVNDCRIHSVVFHSQSSVTRILTAFPDLDFGNLECISSGQAVSEKLRNSGIEPAIEARGSWRSLLATLSE